MRNATLYSPDFRDAVDEVEDAVEIAVDAEREPGGLVASHPRARRGYSLLKGRRTRFQAKRRTGKLTQATPVHRGEREIIARN